jgi:hypothetical protein
MTSQSIYKDRHLIGPVHLSLNRPCCRERRQGHIVAGSLEDIEEERLLEDWQVAYGFHVGLAVAMTRLLPFRVVLAAAGFERLQPLQQRVTLLGEEQHADDKQPSSGILPRLIDIGIEFGDRLTA